MILSATVDTSALWSIIGIVVGLLGSFIFYKLGQKSKKLIYTISSQALITNNLSSIAGLEITYQDKPINNLTSTTINLKSVGKEIITMSDFGQATPLCIKTTGKFLVESDLDSIVASNSNMENLLKPVLQDDKTIGLEFDYLSKGDAITFTILHTEAISVAGKLKEGKLLDNNTYEKLDHIVTYAGMGIAALILVFLYVLSLGPEKVIVDMVRLLGGFLVGTALISYYQGISKR